MRSRASKICNLRLNNYRGSEILLSTNALSKNSIIDRPIMKRVFSKFSVLQSARSKKTKITRTLSNIFLTCSLQMMVILSPRLLSRSATMTLTPRHSSTLFLWRQFAQMFTITTRISTVIKQRSLSSPPNRKSTTKVLTHHCKMKRSSLP